MPNYQYSCTSLNGPQCLTNNNNNYFIGACVGDKT